MVHSKGQSSMMEYILISFFMLLAIIALIFFLGWFHFSQLGMEQQQIKMERTDVLMNRLINSPIFVRENSVFDDSRLMAIQSLGTSLCQDLERLFGSNWFMEIEAISTRPGCAGPCDASTYPCCGYWEICPPEHEPLELNKRVLPANVYRKAEDRVDLAFVTVGVYE